MIGLESLWRWVFQCLVGGNEVTIADVLIPLFTPFKLSLFLQFAKILINLLIFCHPCLEREWVEALKRSKVTQLEVFCIYFSFLH